MVKLVGNWRRVRDAPNDTNGGGNWGEVGGRVGGCQQVGVLVDVAQRAEGRRACAARDRFVVSDVVESISVGAVTLVLRERVQQWTS